MNKVPLAFQHSVGGDVYVEILPYLQHLGYGSLVATYQGLLDDGTILPGHLHVSEKWGEYRTQVLLSAAQQIPPPSAEDDIATLAKRLKEARQRSKELKEALTKAEDTCSQLIAKLQKAIGI